MRRPPPPPGSVIGTIRVAERFETGLSERRRRALWAQVSASLDELGLRIERCAPRAPRPLPPVDTPNDVQDEHDDAVINRVDNGTAIAGETPNDAQDEHDAVGESPPTEQRDIDPCPTPLDTEQPASTALLDPAPEVLMAGMNPRTVARAIELRLITVDEAPRFLGGCTLDEALAQLDGDNPDADA